MSNDQEMYTNLAKAAMSALERGSLGQAMEILGLMTSIHQDDKTPSNASEMPQDQRSTPPTTCEPTPHHPEYWCQYQGCKPRWIKIMHKQGLYLDVTE